MTNEEAIIELNRLFPYIRAYQKLARDVLISKIFFKTTGVNYFRYSW